MTDIPIIIPAYEPDNRLLELLADLKEAGLFPVILVDDGSGEKYQHLFQKAKSILDKNITVISYSENRGKGYALKTAFQYILTHDSDAIGAVTADSDGQHTVDSIKKVRDALLAHPNHLVMGVRKFNKKEIPWKSWFGNTLTVKVFHISAGFYVSDTQSGLRGIPTAFMKQLLEIRENRYEFEIRMLIESKDHFPVLEVPIQTVYESKDNHQTHFKPFRDSVRIYRVLLGRFIKYIFSSLSSSIIDLGLFELFCILFRNQMIEYVALATILARIISATYNYLINYKVVFRSNSGLGSAAVRYFTLAVIQMSLSAFLVTGGVRLFPMIPEVIVKMIIDICLFFISYYIQKRFVFQKA